MLVGLLIKPPSPSPAAGMGRKLMAMTLGSLAVYAVGIPWLGLNLYLIQGKVVSLNTLLMMGMVPFLPGDALKALLAAWMVGPAERALGRE